MENDIERGETSVSTTSRAPASGPRLIVPLQQEERDTEAYDGHADAAPPDFSVEVDDDSDSCFFAPLSGDVDDGGLFLSTWQELAVGAEIVLEILLPDGAARVHGIVLFRRDASDASTPGYGVALELRDPEAVALVRAFCAHRPPLFYDV